MSLRRSEDSMTAKAPKTLLLLLASLLAAPLVDVAGEKEPEVSFYSCDRIQVFAADVGVPGPEFLRNESGAPVFQLTYGEVTVFHARQKIAPHPAIPIAKTDLYGSPMKEEEAIWKGENARSLPLIARKKDGSVEMWRLGFDCVLVLPCSEVAPGTGIYVLKPPAERKFFKANALTLYLYECLEKSAPPLPGSK